MNDNIVFKAFRLLKQLAVYQPVQTKKPFVLEEVAEDQRKSELPQPDDALQAALSQLDKLLNYAHDLRIVMENTLTLINSSISKTALTDLAQQLNILEKRRAEIEPIRLSYDTAKCAKENAVSVSLPENEHIIHQLFGLPDNKDALIHHFEVPAQPPVKAMLVYLDGMVDKKVITLSILQPLLALRETKVITSYSLGQLAKTLQEHLPNNEIKQVKDYADIVSSITGGDSVLFLDGVDTALIVDTKGFPTRNVSTTRIEQSVRGSQVAFSENLRTNTGLIRTILPSNELITEIIEVGSRAPLKCGIMYMKSIANPELVKEVRRRLSLVKTDYVVDIGVLEQFIEDHVGLPFPQMLSTERPDRVAAHLVEGRVALILNGSPFVHILPVSLFTFFHANEDFSLNYLAGDFMRFLRLIAALTSVTMPSLYLAISYFHQEALPTELALAIAGAREAVPFPTLFEIILMEMSFELIREAGLRIPGVLGSTIGIVGAIILGQAAVAANIVSPIMVVVIAITGLSSFAIPDYRLSFALRAIRFIFLAISATLGLVGLAVGLLMITVTLCTMKSFGMPYLAPIAPKVRPNLDVVIRGHVFRQEERPDQLNTKDRRRQSSISREWTMDKAAGKEGDKA